MKKILIAFSLMLTLIGTLFITTKTYAYTYDSDNQTFEWNWEELEFNESNSRYRYLNITIQVINGGLIEENYLNSVNMPIHIDANGNNYINILDNEHFRISYSEDEGYSLQFSNGLVVWNYVTYYEYSIGTNSSYYDLNYTNTTNNYNYKYEVDLTNTNFTGDYQTYFDVDKIQDQSIDKSYIFNSINYHYLNHNVNTLTQYILNTDTYFHYQQDRVKTTIRIPRNTLDIIQLIDSSDIGNKFDTEEELIEYNNCPIGKHRLYKSSNNIKTFINQELVKKDWTNVDNMRELQDTIEQLQNQMNVFNNGNILSQKIYFNDTLQDFNDWDYVFKAQNRLLEIDSSGIRDIYDANGNVNIRYEIELKEPFSVYNFHGKIESIEDIDINIIKTNGESEYYISYNSTSGENGDGYFNYGIVQNIKKIIITTQANDQRPNAYNYIDFGGNYQQGYNDGYLSAKEYYERLIHEKEEQIQELEDTIQSLEQDKIELQARIEELEQLNSNLEIQIDNYTSSILNYMDTIEELQNEIRIKNNNIATLTSEKQALTTQYNELLERYNNITSDNNDLYSMIIAVADTPINIFKNIFNFNVLGIDVSGTIFAIISLIIIVWLIKKII